MRRLGTLVGILAALLAAGAFALLLLFAAPFLPPVSRAIEAGIARALEARGIAAADVRLLWPSALGIEGVAASDVDGVFFRARRIEARVSPLSLLVGELRIERLALEGGALPRPPAGRGGPGGDVLRWPRTPLIVTIADARAEVVVARPPPYAGVALLGEGRGSLSSLGAVVDLKVAREGADAPLLVLAGRVKADLAEIDLALDVRDEDLAASLLGVPALSGFAATAKAERAGGGLFATLDAVTDRLGPLRLTTQEDGSFRAHIEEVARASGEGHEPISGPLTITGTLDRLAGLDDVAVTAWADLGGLKARSKLIARLLEGAVATATFDRQGTESRVSAFDLTLGKARAAIAGEARFGAAGLAATFRGNVHDLGLIDDDLAGSGQLTGTLRRAGNDQKLEATFALPDLTFGSLAWTNIRGRMDIGADLAGTAVLAGEGAVPFDLAGGVDLSAGVGSIGPLQGKIAAGEGEASVLVGGDWQVFLAGRGVNLADIAPLAKARLAGRADIDALVEPSVDGISLIGSAASAEGRAGGLEWRGLALDAKGPFSALEITLAGDAILGGHALPLASRAVLDTKARTLTFSSASAQDGEMSLRLAKPAVMGLEDGIHLPAADLALARGARAAGTARLALARDKASLRLDLKAAQVDVAGSAVLPFEGQLDGRFAFDGGKAAASFSASLEKLRLRREWRGPLPRADLTLAGSWAEGRVRLTAEAAADAMRPARGNLTFALARASDGGWPAVPAATPIEGDIVWRGRAASLWPLLGLEGHQLDGVAAIDAAIGGSLGEPRLGGAASLADGTYTNDVAGTALRALDLVANLEGEAVAIEGRAEDGNGGTLALAGGLEIKDPAGTATFTLSLDKARLLRRDEIAAALTGLLEVGSADGALQLTGVLTASEVRARIPRPLPPDIVTIEVIYPDAPVEEMSSAAAPVGSLDLDVAVDIPGPALIEGRGLSSLWRGNLSVRGTNASPRLLGRLVLLRGGLDFAGRRLELSRGTVDLDGGDTFDPRLDIAATTRADGIEAEIGLEGRISALELEASSVPAMPEDEVLARVLFGKRVDQLSALEALQLARSIAALSGTIDPSGGVLASLREAVGIDVLDIGNDGTGVAGTTVTVGKYVGNGVFVGAKGGATPGASRGTIEIEVTEEITLETEVGADKTGGVGITWSRDY